MAAIAVPNEVCEGEGKMTPHIVVRSLAERVTQPTSPASISAATEGDVRDGPGFPGRDSGRAFSRLASAGVNKRLPLAIPVNSDGRERAVGLGNQDTGRVLPWLVPGATTTRVVCAKRTARRVIHPGLPCSHLW